MGGTWKRAPLTDRRGVPGAILDRILWSSGTQTVGHVSSSPSLDPSFDMAWTVSSTTVTPEPMYIAQYVVLCSSSIFRSTTPRIIVKRAASDTSSVDPLASSEAEDEKPTAAPAIAKSPSGKTARHGTPKSTPTKPKGNVQANGQWTPEKKANFMDDIIASGYKHSNLDDLSIKVGRTEH